MAFQCCSYNWLLNVIDTAIDTFNAIDTSGFSMQLTQVNLMLLEYSHCLHTCNYGDVNFH